MHLRAEDRLPLHPERGGEVERLLQDLDWTRVPLPHPGEWPPSLRGVVRLMLNSSFPMFLVLGADRILLYNDAYRSVLGTKHPHALGRPFYEIWPEVLDTVEPMIYRAYAGEALFFEDASFTLERSGIREEAFFTFSYSPVEDETGSVIGSLCTCIETTKAVRARRRGGFLLELERRLRNMVDPLDVISAAEQSLGEHLGVSRVGYGDVDKTGRYFTTPRNWTDGTVTHNAGTHDLLGFGPEILAAIQRGDTLVVHDVNKDPRTNTPDRLAAFAYIETIAVVTVSLIKDGRLTAAMYVHDRLPRAWTDDVVELIQDVAERTWSAVERARAETALREREDHYRHFLDLSPQVPWMADTKGRIVDISPSWFDVTGLSTEQALGEGWMQVVHPDDMPGMAEAVLASLSRGEPLDVEHRVRLTDGRYGWMRSRAYPRRNEEGEIIRWYGTSEDIQDRKAFEEHQQLLINELNHRVKNTLATVQSIASQTLRNVDTMAQAKEAIEGRLIALSRAHDVLTRENWEAAGLREIVTQAMEPYKSMGKDRISYEGPAIRVAPNVALTIAMAFQELATNAIKYGALSNEAGRVEIRWTVDAGREPPRLNLRWEETGGPPVEPPTRQGFGIRLIERSLPHDVGGNARVAFQPSGVVCTIEAAIA